MWTAHKPPWRPPWNASGGWTEAPGWGYQLPAERVLREMHEVGLTATEFGPDGFLPPDPRPLLQKYDGPVADVRRSADHLRALLA